MQIEMARNRGTARHVDRTNCTVHAGMNDVARSHLACALKRPVAKSYTQQTADSRGLF